MKETIYGLSSATWAYKRRGGEWDQQNPWALVSRAEREQGDGKCWYVCCDTPAGFSTLQTKHSAATRQILALFQGNKQKTKTVYSNHSVKAARNLNSSLFLLPCSDISGMKEKTFFPKGKSLKVLRLQKHLFLPFLPALPSEEPFSQESRSLLVPIAGARCFSTQWGKLHSRGCKGCWWHTFSTLLGWPNPVLLFYSAQPPEWMACRAEKCQEADLKEVPIVLKAGKLCSQAIHDHGSVASPSSFPMFLLYSAGGKYIECKWESTPTSLQIHELFLPRWLLERGKESKFLLCYKVSTVFHWTDSRYTV